MKHILFLLAVLTLLTLAACDSDPNPGSYPCSSQVAPCSHPTPALNPIPIR